MRENGKTLEKPQEVTIVKSKMEEDVLRYRDKIRVSEDRIKYRKDNREFELHRGRFYRKLEEEETKEHSAPRDEMKSFWSGMWNKEEKARPKRWRNICWNSGELENKVFPLLEEFKEMRLLSWKAAGRMGCTTTSSRES